MGQSVGGRFGLCLTAKRSRVIDIFRKVFYNEGMEVVLASRSPRRIDLLKRLVKDFEVEPADVDERLGEGVDPRAAVVALAQKKAEAVAARFLHKAVIGADTVVYADKRILGKPKSKREAFLMLKSLEGGTHSVFTGVCVVLDGFIDTACVESRVTFGIWDKAALAAYIDSEKPMDKAGAYGLQELDGIVAVACSGSRENVMGLPLCETRTLLKRAQSSIK